MHIIVILTQHYFFSVTKIRSFEKNYTILFFEEENAYKMSFR